jgi:hypothetical protein
MLASGYFMIGSNFNPEGWDYMFRWQPLSFVDSGTDGSSGWSRILHDRAQTDGATEAFSFLGVGVIAMMSMALAKLTLIKSSHHKRSGTLIVGVPIVFVYLSIKQHYPTNFLSLFAFLLVSLFVLVLGAKLVKNRLTFKFYSPLCIAVSLLAIYSLTNRVGFGQRTLFEFPLFPPLRQFTETFRTHGRSIWPLYYLVVLGTVVFFVKLISKKYVSLFLFVTLCFTLIDTSEAISSARQRFTDSPRWTSPLRNPLWKDLSSKYQSIVLIPPLNNDADDHWIVFNDLAAQYHLATNSGNFSRFNEDQYYSWNDMTKDETIARIESINAIYVIFDQSIWDELQKRIINPYFIGRVNNFAVYAP